MTPSIMDQIADNGQYRIDCPYILKHMMSLSGVVLSSEKILPYNYPILAHGIGVIGHVNSEIVDDLIKKDLLVKVVMRLPGSNSSGVYIVHRYID